MRLPWSQIDLRWTPHVPGLAANPTTCAAAGRHRRFRACEVHARYEAVTSPEAMSAVRQLAPGHADQPQQAGGTPARGPRAGKPRRRPLGPAAPTLPARQSVTVSRTVTPVISAPPSRPSALRENTGGAGRTHGDRSEEH